MVEVVAAVLTRPDGRVLACRRSPGLSAAGLRESPGGKVEHCEQPGQALRRELREELAIDAVIAERIDRSVKRVGAVDIDLANYRVPYDGEDSVVSTDHDSVRWMRLEALLELEWAAPDLPKVVKLSAPRSSNPGGGLSGR